MVYYFYAMILCSMQDLSGKQNCKLKWKMERDRGQKLMMGKYVTIIFIKEAVIIKKHVGREKFTFLMKTSNLL